MSPAAAARSVEHRQSASSRESSTSILLGRRLGLGSAAATGLADRLEAAGHVTRERHAHDRRRPIVAPTAGARRELFSRVGPLTDATRELAGDFAPAELDAIARFLEAVVALCTLHAAAAGGHG